jgi:glycosyltransferase involved in cell wall biosynthesis
MKVEVLVSTMHQKNCDFLKSMNISTNAIVINQTNFENSEQIALGENTVKFISNNESGIAKSRNKALENSSADICILADDDMQFSDNYEETVIDVFNKHNADIIIFNLIDNENDLIRENETVKKINIFNYMNYGAARIAFKSNVIKDNGLSFKEAFNNNPLPACGEDTLFLRDALKKGFKILAVPEALAKLQHTRESTWFKGYTKEYFFDKGVILGIAHPLLSIPFTLFLVLKHKEYSESGFSKFEIFKEILKGIKNRK